MKREQKINLARRYAQACVHLYSDDVVYADCIAFESAAHFLQSDRRIDHFLQLPVIDNAIKKQAFERIREAYALPAWSIQLFSVLLDHKRTCLLSLIFMSFVSLYTRLKGIAVCRITSAQPLNQDQQAQCVSFLSHLIGKEVKAQYARDQSLIAGIRMQSDEVVWEHSIKKQLRELRHHFCPVGEDYES